ncbi:hypothetical protein ACHAPF_011080 [Botrytis cinerea]
MQNVSLPGNSKNDVKLRSSSRTREKKTLKIQIPAYNRKTSPSKEISPSNSSDSSPDSQQDIDVLLKDLESTRLTNSHLHTDIDDLTSKLKTLVVLKDKLEDTSNQSKRHLLYNANYNQQISAADVKIYFQDIQIYDGIKERRTDDLSEDGLWWVLHNMVILGKMGNPMLAKAAAEDLEIDNMNVETAFLNGELTDTEILMEVPRYFEEIFPEIKTNSKSLVNSCANILQKN